MYFWATVFVLGKRAFDTDPSGTVVRSEQFGLIYNSISDHPKCTPTVEIRTHVSVAGALTSGRPSPLVSKREIWADCLNVKSLRSAGYCIAELSGDADSENNHGGSSMTNMNYIGLDVHKKTISYCVKDAAGQVLQYASRLMGCPVLREQEPCVR
jgi:hypothetical protein